MNKRLKLLRKDILKMTLKEFGKEIGLSTGGLGDIERGRTPLNERHIKLIKQNFNVNEHWLKNGVEPIFIEPQNNILKTLQNEYKLDDTTTNILKTFVELDEFSKNAIVNFLIKSIETYYTNNNDKLDELYNKISNLPDDKIRILEKKDKT